MTATPVPPAPPELRNDHPPPVGQTLPRTGEPGSDGGAGGDQGPGALPLGEQGQVQQQGLLVAAAVDLEADGESAGAQAAGDGHGGVAGHVPRDGEAARVEGASGLQILMKVYVPLARPTYLAYALVSVSYHWNNFLWPLIITNSVESRPVTVGLQVFSATDQGIDWSIITAATLLTSAPLLIAFLLFQRQFVLSFMRAGIK